MRIDLDTILYNHKNEPIKLDEQEATFRNTSIFCLIQPREKATGMDRYKTGELTHKIHNAGQFMDLSVDELKMLKDASGESLSPIGVKAYWDILDGKNVKSDSQNSVDNPL